MCGVQGGRCIQRDEPPIERGDGSMNADAAARLRALTMASEERWRALGKYEATRFLYQLQRLRTALSARRGTHTA
jgi:hypothetical protein